MATQPDWELIDDAARMLGISKYARQKWRDPDRGVPSKWWLPISRMTRGRVTLEELEASKEDAGR